MLARSLIVQTLPVVLPPLLPAAPHLADPEGTGYNEDVPAATGPDASGAIAWARLRTQLDDPPATEHLAIESLDPAVARYFVHALGHDVPHGRAAELEMRGRIKIGRWLPFRAAQLLAPRLGTVWRARVAGVISGSDRYVAGTGGMDWRALHLLPLVHADGPDVSRSAAERAAGESIWVPTAMWPQQAVEWRVVGSNELEVTFDVDGHPVTIRHRTGPDGGLRSSTFQRWGDPDRVGTWAQHPFGVEVTDERTFGNVTIPSEGRVGWHHGTPRWADGIFFEYQITRYRLIT
jgi:hypothetical protein